MKKVFLLFLIVAAAGFMVVRLSHTPQTQPQVTLTQPVSHSSDSSVAHAAVSSKPSSAPAAASSIPGSVLITVPFVTQAPFANWDEVHEETCEEASILLVHAYLTHMDLTEQSAETELQKIVAWENEHLGYYKDTTTEETARIARELYGHTATVIPDITQSQIESFVSQGKPVILPTAGQMLGNPYFSGEGPPYHMIVIVGYDTEDFLAHDVGTKRGKNYHYSKEVVMNALHDWIGSKETITQGPRVGLVIE